MLSDREFEDWCRRLCLPETTKELVQKNPEFRTCEEGRWRSEKCLRQLSKSQNGENDSV
ncbi:hypothetical protein HG267_00005 [Tolypothrix sp. PCC 7601]|nr:hypothetical protein HG267_00005 [Tolypothrix sp. PCC 7601]